MAKTHLDKSDAIATLEIDNPSARNAVTHEMALSMDEQVREAIGDPAIHAIVVRGRGDHFCAGADLKAAATLMTLTEDEMEARIRDAMHPVVQALAESPKPTLAVIRGACVGIGLSYAIACDLRVAAADAKLGLVFTRIGLHPDGGSSYLLPPLVGMGRALEMMLLAPTFSGVEAERIGLVNRAVEANELDELASHWATRLAAGPPIAYEKLKANLRYGASGASLKQVLDREAKTQVACIRSQDAIRGVQAFFAKTPPVFEGN